MHQVVGVFTVTLATELFYVLFAFLLPLPFIIRFEGGFVPLALTGSQSPCACLGRGSPPAPCTGYLAVARPAYLIACGRSGKNVTL